MSPTGKEPWTQYNDVSGHAESVSSETSTPLEMLPPQSSDSPETTYKANETGAYYTGVCLIINSGAYANVCLFEYLYKFTKMKS